MLKWSELVQTLFDFTIIAVALFLTVKAIKRLKRPEPAVPAVVLLLPRSEVLPEEIRDLLKQRSLPERRYCGATQVRLRRKGMPRA
ncbi:MAG: hypothetical protein FJ196_04835 [Gammaproteobacteria bacterium]|nr:hypothetical protein [Gammaproteobacteria bacterium]